MLSFFRVQTFARPPLRHGILGQQIQPFQNVAIFVLLYQQHRPLLLNSGQIDKIPVSIEGIIRVRRFADFRPGKQHKQALRLQHPVELSAVFNMKFFLHKGHSPLSVSHTHSSTNSQKLEVPFLLRPGKTVPFRDPLLTSTDNKI